MGSDVRAKCQFPDGVVIKPDGVNVLDPCFYEEIEVVKHCTVPCTAVSALRSH